jgi:hypothetical protein
MTFGLDLAFIPATLFESFRHPTVYQCPFLCREVQKEPLTREKRK